MKPGFKLALAVLAGVLMGAAGVWEIFGQQVKTPPTLPAYVIAEINVTDPVTMQKYREKLPETFAPFNHHNLVSGGKTEALEGDPPKTIVVIAFDSMEKARAWYDSPSYEAIKPLRQSAATSRVFIVEGTTPQ